MATLRERTSYNTLELDNDELAVIRSLVANANDDPHDDVDTIARLDEVLNG